MLDYFAIYTLGGIVLWSRTMTKLKGNPVNELIKKVLLEERGGNDFYEEGTYGVKWSRDNDRGLFFVAVFQKIAKAPYIDVLLHKVKVSFVSAFSNDLSDVFNQEAFKSFDKKYESLLAKAQAEMIEEKEKKGPRDFYSTSKGIRVANTEKGQKDIQKQREKREEEEEREREREREKKIEEQKIQEEQSKSNMMKSISLSNTKRPGGAPRAFSKKKTDTSNEPLPGSKRTKDRNQHWNSREREIPVDDLNFGGDGGKRPEGEDEEYLEKSRKEFGVEEETKLTFSSSSEEDSSNEEESKASSGGGGLFSFFSSMTNKELQVADLAPVLDQFRTSLVTKNVAQEIAEQLCNSVLENLVGKKLGTFSRVTTAVQEAMEAALTRILTPKRNIDILRDIRIAKQEGRPYVITFVGVNGVGKSTTLAKVCSWLLQNQLKPLVAACDTFRSGAIEQLAQHCRNLNVELFHRGYGKSGKDDATSVAQQAIKKAADEGFDVVLVDTSGRMQGNVKLMKELATLVGVNSPDVVLFIGEALAGNDSVDQLKNFNKSLMDYSVGKVARGIDGIILTKFDTVDEKVGTAISMVYSTGQPIVFVGVGQKYSDLRVLDIHKIVSILKK